MKNTNKIFALILALLFFSTSINAEIIISIDGGEIKDIVTDQIRETNFIINSDESKDVEFLVELLDKDARVINRSMINTKAKHGSVKFNSYNKITKDAFVIRAKAVDDNENNVSNILNIPIENRIVGGAIVDVSDYEATIKEGEDYNPPKTLKAKLTSGEVVDVKVEFEAVDYSKLTPGEYIYEGKIDGYSESVKLLLKVESVGKITSVDELYYFYYKDDNIVLPSEVLVNMSDGSTKFSNITWEEFDRNAGVHNIKGNVEGYGEIIAKLEIVDVNSEDELIFKNTELANNLAYIKTYGDAINCEEIDLSWSYLMDSNLGDLKYFKNLKNINLSWSGLKVNTRDLSNNRSLQEINLFSTELDSISGLENIKDLVKINLASNANLSDINALKNAMNLKEININSTAVKDIRVLADKPLTKVDHGKSVKDNSPLLGINTLIEPKEDNIRKLEVKNGVLTDGVKFGEEYILPYKVVIDGSIKVVDWDKYSFIPKAGEEIIISGHTDIGEIKFILNGIGEFEDREIKFPDKNLEKAVRKSIDKFKGAIMLSDVINLKELAADSYGIKNLDGIENLTGLERLSLWANNITTGELIKLKGLSKLTSLILSNNQILDIPEGIFVNMSKLEELVLDSNKISNIDKEAFKGLENLRDLLIAENKINNIDACKNLKHLKNLHVDHNAIKTLEPISHLTELEWIRAGYNNISDLSPMKAMSNINWIDMPNNNISSLDVLKDKTKLYRLDFSKNNITDLLPLFSLEKMEWLSMNDNKIADLYPIRNLTNLTSLDLKNNKITSVAPLKNMVYLKSLYLAGNNISDIESIRHIAIKIKARDFDI